MPSAASNRIARALLSALPLSIALLPAHASAQSMVFRLNNSPSSGSAAPMYQDAATRAFVQNQKLAEREIKRIRLQYIRRNNDDLRAQGFARLEKYTAPSEVSALMACLKDEGPEVQKWLVDHIATRVDQDVAQATLAYLAIYDSEPSFRQAARARVSGTATDRTRWVIERSLASPDPLIAGGGSGLALQLHLIEAIPHLIAAQSQRLNTGGEGDIAWIAVGTQRYFVSDLTPVVGEGSAGFDPTLTPYTEGTVVAIRDAVAISYRYEVHTNLVNLIKADTGQDVEYGFDQDRWIRWYHDEYLPMKKAQLQQQQLPPGDPAAPNPADAPDATPNQPQPGGGHDG